MSFLRCTRLLIFILLADSTAGLAQTAPETLPPVKLRGYGELSGKWQTFDHGSLLQIACESEDKARIAQAKYISDLQELPGVQASSVQGPQGLMATWTFGTEVFLAARDGTNVDVLTADSPAALLKLAQTALPATATHFKPEVEVPMFLDRWDKYGFRFYYDSLSVPDGKNLVTFDKNTEFDWSAKNMTGLQLWDPVYEFDTAQGITTKNAIQWAIDAAVARKLPLGINLSTNNQTWLEDWYPDEMAQHMPQFLGAYYNGPMMTEDGMRFLSWDATIGEDTQLATIQQDVKHFTTDENVTSWLEPHGEMGHGDSDFLMDYGPVADKTFRSWLQNRYQTVQAVSQRYTGKPDSFASWDDVHVPEMASFCGWSPDALDLTGTWKVKYLDQAPKKDQPIDYPNETFSSSYDDSSWPDVVAPGDAHASFLPKFKPAVFRRTFNVDAAWLQAHPKQWLYVFDMNRTRDKLVIATLNGKEIGRSPVIDPTEHRDWYESTGALRAGANTLVLALPDGYLAYRVYFSGTAPRMYPDLGEQLNAKWADFADWATWSRVQKAQRGMEMIRQVDPNRGIILMSPGTYYGGEQEIARMYGGDFHDTGGMAGWWNDIMPQLMNGVGLPSSVEPGGPARTVHDLEAAYGYWSTEGSNAVDYFLTLGDVFWHDDLRADFEANLKLWKLFGKDHFAPPQYASLVSERDANRLSFPWNIFDKNLVMQAGFIPWAWYDQRYPGQAAICEQQFLNNFVDRYKVVIDSNTSIMDPDMVDAIERYVKQGGIFVTYVETGRHSDTKANSWPISKLTGYDVVSIDPHPNNGLQVGSSFDLAPGQTLFAADKMDPHLNNGSGLHLRKVAPDCQDLLVWKDGTIAAGMRPLGKGYIIDFGVHTDSVGWGDARTMTELFDAVLDFAKIPQDPVQLQNVALDPSVLTRDADTRGFMYRHFLSNNGLYDVFTFWNMNKNPLNADLVFPADGPATATVVKTGASVALVKNEAGAPTLKISLAPNEPESYITPRPHLENAARAWFDLQREWWKGATPPPPNHLPSLADIHRQTLPLGEGWSWKMLTDKDDAATLAAPTVDDAAWPKSDFAAQLVPIPAANTPGNTLLFRKQFTVPADWTKGPTVLYLTSTESTTFIDSARIYIDGSMVKPSTGGVYNEGFDGLFKPGSSHLLAVEIPSKSCIVGNVGAAWLYYRPDATEEMDLAGDWESSIDGLLFNGKTSIPGPWDTNMARGIVNIPASHAKQTVLMHFEFTGRISGAIINGTYISQSHVPNCPSFDLNVTPWIKFGQDNKVEIVSGGRSQANVTKIAFDFYDPGTYP
jgi:hypothetical protein